MKLFCAHLLQISVPTFVNFSKTGKYGFHCGHSCKVERLGVRLKIYKQRNYFFPFFPFYADYHLYVGDQRFELFHSTQKKVLERLKMENQKKISTKNFSSTHWQFSWTNWSSLYKKDNIFCEFEAFEVFNVDDLHKE